MKNTSESEINNLHKYTFLYNSYITKVVPDWKITLFAFLIKYSICQWLEFFFFNLHKLVTKY